MNDSANQFIGSIPENYDNGLGPNIFVDYADDLARRAGAGASDVLELAAGTGIVSRRLRDALAPGARLTVTDLNPPMLEVAQAKFHNGEAVEFTQANAMELPFGNAQFDLVVCQFGVMFFPDKTASYREAARVLRPDGGQSVFPYRPRGNVAVLHRRPARFLPRAVFLCRSGCRNRRPAGGRMGRCRARHHRAGQDRDRFFGFRAGHGLRQSADRRDPAARRGRARRRGLRHHIGNANPMGTGAGPYSPAARPANNLRALYKALVAAETA
jgi:SAM-dependent methyltransferase